MDIVEKILREACARSKDGRITPEDFANQASRSMRYSTFSPMEIAIIFHFAGVGKKERLSLRDFAALVDPKWGPAARVDDKPLTTGSFGHESLKVSSQLVLKPRHRTFTNERSCTVGVLLPARRRRRCSGRSDGQSDRRHQDTDAESAVEGRRRAPVQQCVRLRAQDLQKRRSSRLLPGHAAATCRVRPVALGTRSYSSPESTQASRRRRRSSS